MRRLRPKSQRQLSCERDSDADYVLGDGARANASGRRDDDRGR